MDVPIPLLSEKVHIPVTGDLEIQVIGASQANLTHPCMVDHDLVGLQHAGVEIAEPGTERPESPRRSRHADMADAIGHPHSEGIPREKQLHRSCHFITANDKISPVKGIRH